MVVKVLMVIFCIMKLGYLVGYQHFFGMLVTTYKIFRITTQKTTTDN